MSDSDSDSDNFWGDDDGSKKLLKPSTITTPPSAKKAEIKLSFSIPSLPTSPTQDYTSETESKYSDVSSYGKPPRYPALPMENSGDESYVCQDEDKSDLHEILDSLLNFESIIEPQLDEIPEKPYTHSRSLASLDTYGGPRRSEEVQRENLRLAKQIKQSKSCLGKSPSQKSSAAISAANQSINRTKLSRLERENLNLLKRIQSAKSSKSISRKEHEKHFESHKVYGKISSKHRQPNLSATSRVEPSMSQPEWNI